jgi:hypothetical protein
MSVVSLFVPQVLEYQTRLYYFLHLFFISQFEDLLLRVPTTLRWFGQYYIVKISLEDYIWRSP